MLTRRFVCYRHQGLCASLIPEWLSGAVLEARTQMGGSAPLVLFDWWMVYVSSVMTG
jgi:hypothetical protein